MGGQDDGGTRARQRGERVQQVVHRFRVQAGGGLVQEQDAGPHGDRAGDGHALALPEGQVVGGPVGEIADVQRRHRLVDAGHHLSARQAQVDRTE